jgi:hypothetical protein
MCTVASVVDPMKRNYGGMMRGVLFPGRKVRFSQDCSFVRVSVQDVRPWRAIIRPASPMRAKPHIIERKPALGSRAAGDLSHREP